MLLALPPRLQLVTADDLELDGAGGKASAKEVRMAGQLVESLAEDFKPENYVDEYREAVLDLIKRKAKGEEIELPEPEEAEAPDDLMAALEASLGKSKPKGSKSRSKSRS